MTAKGTKRGRCRWGALGRGAIVLAAVGASAGCRQPTLVSADGGSGGTGGAAGGSGGTAEVAADDAAAVLDAPSVVDVGPAGSPDDSGAPGCLGRGPAGCNDNPAVSALWGTCLAGGFCQCNDGFSVNPATGRCRPGNLCKASGADPWPTTVAFDHADCATRTATPCDSSGTIAPGIFALALQCRVRWHEPVRIELVDGCPIVLNFSGFGDARDAAVVSCLTDALSGKRWACGGATDCVMYLETGLP